jgi:hypothetical protein
VKRPGRPPGTPLTPDRGEPALVQVAGADVDLSGRLTIPVHLGQAVGWLNPQAKQDLLLVLPRPGVVELYAWEPHGVGVLAKQSELEARNSADAQARAALTQLALRYRRLALGKGFRCSLPIDVRLHLGMREPGAGRLYVLRSGERLELVSKEAMDEAMGEGHEELEGLP